MTELLDLGIGAIQWASELRSPALTRFMLVVTDLGSAAGYLALLPILWWGVSWKLGLRIFTVLVVSVYVNAILKDVVALPRPFVYADVDNLRVPSSLYSFPSGHAQQAAVFWGMIAVHFRHAWLTGIAAMLVFLIGASRIYLGVHYPTDVIAGWALGGAIVWGATQHWERVSIRARAARPLVGVAMGCAIPALLALSHPESTIVIAMGGLAGALSGCVVAQSLGLYPVHGNDGVRRSWLFVGVVGLPLIVVGLAATTRWGESSLSLQWLRVAALGLWVSLLVPWVAKLATRREAS